MVILWYPVFLCVKNVMFTFRLETSKIAEKKENEANDRSK